MLDDSVMDKKSVPRTNQATKGSNLETKFKQDAASKFSRAVRRTDNATQRQEPLKKLNSRKNKVTTDKRPRPRGFVSFDRDRSEVVEGDLLEAGVAVTPGSKKINLNHLLNFTFAKREHGLDSRGNQYGNYGKHKPPKYNKEQYLQANCQFVVREGGNYTINLVDPDIIVDWTLVEQVLLPCDEVPSCPICLYPATAAKITRCGHIYCWVCILHYLSLSERSWHKCPICYEAIHKRDLKSAVSLSRSSPKVGEEIILSLMQREKGSLFSVPVHKWTSCPSDHFRLGEDSEVTCFQKLLIATKEDVLNIIEQEHIELQSQISNSDDSEIMFYDSALELLRERHQPIQIKEHDHLPALDNMAKDNDIADSENLNLCSGITNNISENLNKTNDDNHFDECHQELLEELDLEPINSANNNDQIQKSFFFYQASDGQHIYLNSLNVRMLIEEYGSLEKCPPLLKATVVELDNVTVSKILRNRLRYLQHLPLTCQFQIVELHFETPLVSPSTLQFFNVEIEKRRRARTRKLREERRRERHIELEENKKIGKFPSAKYSLDSFQQFPTYNSVSTDEDPPLNSDDKAKHFSASDSLPVDTHCDESEQDHSTSFAQMLRQGKARPTSVYPIEMKPKTLCVSTTTLNSINSDEESAPAPEYHLSFGDAIEEAINSMTLTSEKNPSGQGKKGKKKKNKNTVLFTTSMNRSK